MLNHIKSRLLRPGWLLLALIISMSVPVYATPPDPIVGHVDGRDAAVIEAIIGQSEVGTNLGWLSGNEASWNTNLTWNNAAQDLFLVPSSQVQTMDIRGQGVTGSLDLSGLQSLKDFNASSNQLTSLTLHQAENHTLTTLNVSSNQLSSLDVSKNLALTYRGGSLF